MKKAKLSQEERGFAVFQEGPLRIVYERSPGPLTGVVVAARSGSRFDGEFPGIAHLAEHMLFQGTRKRDHAAINQRAAELGGDHDASTGYEDLSLTFQVLNDDMADAVSLLAEQALESTVPEDRLENERQVVAQEIRGHREDAISYLNDETWRRFFEGGLSLPPSGTLDSVRRMRAEDVRRFLRQRLVGANLVLSVVGDVSLVDVRRAARRAFGRLGMGRPCRPNGSSGLRRGEVRLHRSGLTQLYLATMFDVPHDARSLVALGMALEILGTDPDGRLYHEVRERRGLSYDLWTDVQSGAGWAVVVFGAVAERRAEKRLRAAMEEVFTTAATSGFSKEEVARARRKVAYRYARLGEAKLDRAASHAASILYGAPSIEEAAALVASLGHAELEMAWAAALGGRRLTGVLTG